MNAAAPQPGLATTQTVLAIFPFPRPIPAILLGLFLILFLGGRSLPAAEAASGTTLVINEIHYDPAVKTELVEYIELYNPGDAAVNLAGWAIEGGIEYAFPTVTIPAGDYFILAQNAAHFQTKFSFAPDGVYAGKLDNEGEEIELLNAAGEKIDEVEYEAGFPWPTSGEGSAIELVNPGLDNAGAGHWRSGGPTPAAQNATFSPNAPTDIRKINHFPHAPASGEAVTITAKISDREGVAAVVLEYQTVDPGSYIALTDDAYQTQWLSLPMIDDGTGGDSLAADEIFTAVLPAIHQQHRRLVRYRIRVTDGLGTVVRVPYPDDPQPNFAYFVYDGPADWVAAAKPGDAGDLGTLVTYQFDALPQQIPIYHLITKNSDVNQAHYDGTWNSDDGGNPYAPGNYRGSDYPWYGTLVYEGVVYDHITYRARGGMWRYAKGKNMWKFNFNRGHGFQASDDYGHAYSARWDRLNLSAVIQLRYSWHRGEQGMFESVGFKLFGLAGLEASHTNFVHFRIIDDAAETGETQYEGDFWGLYLAVEQLDGNFLDEHGLPDGNLYKMEAGSGELSNQGPTAATDKSDLNNFMSSYDGPQRDNETWWRANMDLARYYSYRAIVEAIHHYDIGAGKNYFYYLNPETHLWSTLPWDLDLTWADNMYDAGGKQGNEPFKSRVAHNPNLPVFNIEYQNRLREIRDLLYNDDQAHRLIDEYAALIDDPNGQPSMVDADRARWDYNPLMVNESYIDPSKAGQGAYHQWPTSTAHSSFLPVDPSLKNDFPGMVAVMKRYVTVRSAWIDNALLTDTVNIPATPMLTYTGAPAYPSDQLRFQTSPFSDPQGDGFGALEWRIGEVSYPGIAGYDPTQPARYEITAVWESGVLTRFNDTVSIPHGVVMPGRTYRARVRMQDVTGRWSHWSQPVEFTAAPPTPLPEGALIISELMYNPPGKDAEGYEFIELKNTHTGSLRLDAVRISGIDYVFPAGTQLAPGAFIVLARNPAAFRAHYGLDPFNDTGYAGKLVNGGETLAVIDSGATPLFTMLYGDEDTWPEAADGFGYSLVSMLPNSNPDPTLPGNWRLSTSLGGSPGQDDPTLLLADTGVTEAERATADFAVTLSAMPLATRGITTTLNVTTADGTAFMGSDYISTTQAVSFAAHEIQQTVSIPIVNDNRFEVSETFALQLYSQAGVLLDTAVGTLVDDDPLPAISINDVVLPEGSVGTRSVTFNVNLSAASGAPTRIAYTTLDQTATAGSDYNATSGGITFAPGQTVRTVSVFITGDTLFEADEVFLLKLSSPVNAVLADDVGQATLLNDDAPFQANAVQVYLPFITQPLRQ